MARSRQQQPAKPGRGKASPPKTNAKTTATRPAKPKAGRARQASSPATSSRPDAPTRPPVPQQIAVPGTEQLRDEVFEREWLELKDAKDERKAAGERIAEREAAIQKHFEDLAAANKRDPRAHSYRVDDGAVLYPKVLPKLGIKRPPSKVQKAKDDLDRSGGGRGMQQPDSDDDWEG